MCAVRTYAHKHAQHYVYVITMKDDFKLLKVYLNTTYFTEIENLLLKVL